MENADGTSHTWNVNGIIKACNQLNLTSKEKSPNYGDITYLANMAYADFYPKVISDSNGCIKYAIAVVEDVDGYEGMAFYRWLADVEHKPIDIDWSKFL